MVDPNTRSGKRTPVTLKIKFKSETLEQFIERYAVDVSQGGIFIRTKEPLAVGTQMKFEFQLKDASPLIAGEGTVVWTRENDPSRPAIAPGMGVRFDKLADGSQSVLERILAEKAKQAPQRPMKDSTKPPMFTDTPTRVAPAPMQEALLGENAGSGGPRRKRPDSQEEKTPLPKPVPFHSDADEFSEEAFEEATKVRALDELVAQTAMAETGASPKKPSPEDELAARRNNLFKDESAPPVAPAPLPAEAKTPTEHERDSAPGLPSPPEPQRPSPRILDTSPSPRESSTTSPPIGVSSGAAARTQLGMGASPSASASIKNAETIPSGIIPIPTEPKRSISASSSANLPAAGKRPSSMPIILGIIFFVAAAGAALWFFVLREPSVDTIVQPPKPNLPGSNGSAGSAAIITPGSAVDKGSAGSAVVVDKGSAAVPAAATVDTVLASPTDKVTIEVEGTDQKGPAPLTAKLEKDKAYKIKLSAPGFITNEFDVKGGEAKVSKKLDPKKFIVTITTTPPGATFAFDGVIAKSPFEMKAPPKKAVRVRIVKSGYKPAEVVIDADKWTDEPTQMTFTQDVTLVVAPVVIQTPHQTPDAGSGSAAVPTGNGSGSETGSAATPPPPPPPPPAGSDAPAPTP